MIKLSNFSAFGMISNPHLLIKRAWEHWRWTAGPNWSSFTFDYDIVAPLLRWKMGEVLRSACLTVMELVKPLTRWILHHLAWPFSSSHALACICDNSIIIIVSGKHRASTSQGLCPDHWPWDGRAHTRKVTRRDGSLELLRCWQRFDFFSIFHLRGNPEFFAGWRTTSEWKRRDQRKVEEWDHQESPPPIHMK